MFTDIILHERLQKALDAQGIKEATQVQAQAIPLAIQGKDLLVSAETGSGKTFAFLLPMLQRFLEQPAPNRGTRALILVPTRELAEQVTQSCIKLAAFTHIKTLTICGGSGFKEQAAKLRKNPEIVVGTPGRIKEHLELNSLVLSDIEFLILDEADRMLDMGFREDVTTITSSCATDRQTMLFSATLKTRDIEDLIEQVLKSPERLILSTAQDQISTILQQIVLADDIKHKERLISAILNEEKPERAVVFTNTRAASVHLGNVLKYHKHRTASLHGEMDQVERRKTMRFFRDGHVQVLVATDVAARGLDIDGVDLVINFEMPRSGDEYVHRIGRTGRAGKSGTAITLIAPSEWNLMRSVERYLKLSFTQRAIEGFVGHYKGPEKVKSSGKAAGNKKKKELKDKVETKPKVKERHRDKKSIGKRRAPSSSTESAAPVDQGFAPLKKRKAPDAG